MAEPEQPHAAARPYESFGEALEGCSATLAARGLGRWGLRPVPDVSMPVGQPLSIPLLLPDGSLFGALGLVGGAAEAPVAEPDLTVVQLLARLLSTVAALEQRADRAERLAARAEEASLVDPLTGLPNGGAWRTTLVREVKRCERTGVRLAVAVIDLDDLKEVNDSEGHLAGDLLLRSAGRAIQGGVRGSDFVARIGGDEFGVIAVDYEDPDAGALLERVRGSLKASSINASIGGAVHRPGNDVDTTFHDADLAMYLDKRTRKAKGR